jgi:uncharacterized membrane protein
MLERGRLLFWALAVSLIAVVLATLSQLPPRVASHFDAAGVPNGWSSRPAYALLLILVGVLLPLGTIGLITLVTRSGPGQLNMPAKEYWTRPEHSSEAIRRVRGYMWWLACIMAGTALAIHGLVLAAHTSAPPHLSGVGIITVLSVVVLAIVGWSAGWFLLLRQPRSE